MHYRHSYHAGNFADVFKHALQVALLAALSRKDKPWCYLDTHAGAGLYDLRAEGERTGEWREGVGRLGANASAVFADYLKIVRALNEGDAVTRYPGSPLVAQALLREGDRLVLCEKVPEVADALRGALGREPRAAVHVRDGYESHALLPPKEKRGLVLIDPPFEARDEFERIGDFLVRALARFAGGVYAVWYPLKNRHEAQRFWRRLERELTQPLLNLTLDNGAPGEGQMRGCGLLLVNPPFGFDAEARALLAPLAQALAQGPRPQWTVDWLRRG